MEEAARLLQHDPKLPYEMCEDVVSDCEGWRNTKSKNMTKSINNKNQATTEIKESTSLAEYISKLLNYRGTFMEASKSDEHFIFRSIFASFSQWFTVF